MKHILLIFLAIIILVSCKNNEPSTLPTSEFLIQKDFGKVALSKTKRITTTLSKNKNIEVNYNTSILKASDYLKRKNIHLSVSEKQELKSESVLIYQMMLEENGKKLLEINSNWKSQDEKKQYLIGNIVNDIQIFQNGKLFKPVGHFFEDHNNSGSVLRILFYFKKLDLKQPMRVLVNDKLINNGLINFSFN